MVLISCQEPRLLRNKQGGNAFAWHRRMMMMMIQKDGKCLKREKRTQGLCGSESPLGLTNADTLIHCEFLIPDFYLHDERPIEGLCLREGERRLFCPSLGRYNSKRSFGLVRRPPSCNAFLTQTSPSRGLGHFILHDEHFEENGLTRIICAGFASKSVAADTTTMQRLYRSNARFSLAFSFALTPRQVFL